LRQFYLCASVVLTLLPPAFPQSQDERAVRAAYVFNITKMVEWPAGKDRLVIGFFGASETGETLRKLLEGKISQSKPIYFLLLPSDAELPRCSLLYFADSENRKIHSMISTLGSTSVLTIGESDSFVRDGGMIGLVKVGQQIHMQINLEGARRAGIKVSPQLVNLAEIVAPGNSATEPPARKIVQRREPEYPPIAVAMSLHGTVKLRVWIAPNGSVRRVDYAGGHPLLAQAAIAAVQSWKFENDPRETTQVVNIDF
jgi:TonB family protein